MNQELTTIWHEHPRYKEAYYSFLESYQSNYKKSTEEFVEFEKFFTRDFVKGIKENRTEREVLIQGERLTIRKARIEDADFIHAVELDPDNSPWVSNWPLGLRIAKFGDPDFLQTIIEKENGTAIGFIIFCDRGNKEGRLQLKRIAILEKGKGYGKEALFLAQKLAFEVFGAKCLYLDTKEENLRAQSIYKTTGFIPDMPDPCTHFHVSIDDRENKKE